MKRTLLKAFMTISLFVSLSVITLCSGCSVDNAANAKSMIPENFDVVKHMPYTVSVNESTGGIKPNPRWSSQISNTEFTTALIDALELSGLFQTVTVGDGADYLLDVSILDYDQPWYGSVMKVRMETTWRLTDAKTQKVVWSNTFPTAYRAEWESSVFDRARIRNAHEGVARANIKEGIRRLSIVEL